MIKKHSSISLIILSIVFISEYGALKLETGNIILAETNPGFINDFLMSENTKFGVESKGEKKKLVDRDVAKFVAPARSDDFTVKLDYPGLDGEASPEIYFVPSEPFVSSDAVYVFNVDTPQLPTGSRIKISIDAPGINPVKKTKLEIIDQSQVGSVSGSNAILINGVLIQSGGDITEKTQNGGQSDAGSIAVSGNSVQGDNKDGSSSQNSSTGTSSTGSGTSTGSSTLNSSSVTGSTSSSITGSTNSSSVTGSTNLPSFTGSTSSSVTGSTHSSSSESVVENGVLTSNTSTSRNTDINGGSSQSNAINTPTTVVNTVSSSSQTTTDASKVLDTLNSGNTSLTGSQGGVSTSDIQNNASTGTTFITTSPSGGSLVSTQNGSTGSNAQTVLSIPNVASGSSAQAVLSAIGAGQGNNQGGVSGIQVPDSADSLFNPFSPRASSAQTSEIINPVEHNISLSPTRTGAESSPSSSSGAAEPASGSVGSTGSTGSNGSNSSNGSTGNSKPSSNTSGSATNISGNPASGSSSTAEGVGVASSAEENFLNFPARTTVGDNGNLNTVSVEPKNATNTNTTSSSNPITKNSSSFIQLGMGTLLIILSLLV